MNRLQLCNALISKAGISGGSIASTTGLTGEALRVANWIDEAWLNIQMAEPNWNWMRHDVSFVTVSGKPSYTPAECGVTDLGEWKMDSFRRYINGMGFGSENYLTQMDYDEWRDTYQFNNLRLVSGDPLFIAVGPDMSLNLGLTQGDVGYTVVGNYYRAPSAMTDNTDVPAMPERFHLLIVYRAMIMYGMYEAAGEVVQEGQSLYGAMLRRLMRDQKNDITGPGALA